MNNTEKPVFRPEANCIWRSFLTSQKKHIVITGGRKSGKSTLLSSLFDRQMPGITSWAVPKEGVYMKITLAVKLYVSADSALMPQVARTSCNPLKIPLTAHVLLF